MALVSSSHFMESDEMTTLNEDVQKAINAIHCGRMLRDTFGGNVGGGSDIFIEAQEAMSRIEAAISHINTETRA